MQELLGHKDVTGTMIYTHVLNRPGIGVKSPLDSCDRIEREPELDGGHRVAFVAKFSKPALVIKFLNRLAVRPPPPSATATVLM